VAAEDIELSTETEKGGGNAEDIELSTEAEKEPVGGSNIVVLLRGYVRYTGGLT